MSALLPLFPLQLVVFPRTQVPLHIFEERYKEMIGAAIRDRSDFGIVLGRNDGIANAGCTVAVDRVVTQYPDGRLDIVTTGKRRFEIVYLSQEKPYLEAEVHFFEDNPEAVPEEARQEAIALYREFTSSENASAAGKGSHPEPILDDPQISFQLAQTIPDLEFQNQILRSRSEVDRLQQLTKFLQQHIPRAKEAARMRHLAPLNGFGNKIAGA